MTNYFQQYRPFLLFLGKFFLSYLLMTLLYSLFVHSYGKTAIDGITSNVAQMTAWIGHFLGFPITTQVAPSQYQIYFDGKYVARVIEGCNAISVIVLFVSFVIAFSAKWKPTVLFILGGGVFIYLLNVLRILLLTVLLHKYPQHEHLLHGVFFPLFIYGIVFLLWIFWIKTFSRYAKK